MKKVYFVLFLLLALFPFTGLLAQNNNVGIGTTSPNATAVLDVTSSNKGVLVPRLTTAQRTAIVSPAQGLLVYDTDLGCFYYYNTTTSAWVSLCQAGPAGPTGPQGVAGVAGVAGTNGVAGPTGPSGADGAAGAAGPAGAAGAPGAPGAAGPAGANGAQGAAGAAGANGATGPTGPIGPGGTGSLGPTGPQGATGAAGTQGTAGANGATGPSGTDGANGAAGATGPSGANGTAGAAGATGPSGANGAAGATGPAGPVGCATANYVVKSTGTSATCSVIYDNGVVGIGTTTPQTSSIGGGNVASFNVVSSATLAGAGMIETTNKSANGVAQEVNNTSASNAYNTLEGITAYSGTAYAPSGIWGLDLATTGSGYGGSCSTNSTNVNSSGLYAQNAGVASHGPWAGYFAGDVYVTGTVTQAGSDRNIKEDIQPLGSVLEKLKKINVYSYNFKPELQKDYGFSTEKTVGVIAQELETVFPDLVNQVSIRAKMDGNSKSAEPLKTMQIKTVDYQSLIPILLKAVKEQQEQIDLLNKKIDQLQQK